MSNSIKSELEALIQSDGEILLFIKFDKNFKCPYSYGPSGKNIEQYPIKGCDHCTNSSVTCRGFGERNIVYVAKGRLDNYLGEAESYAHNAPGLIDNTPVILHLPTANSLNLGDIVVKGSFYKQSDGQYTIQELVEIYRVKQSTLPRSSELTLNECILENVTGNKSSYVTNLKTYCSRIPYRGF